MYKVKSLSKLVNELTRLPGIGPKTAQRLAFHVLSSSKDNAESLAKAILDAKEKIRYCSICGNISEQDICTLCYDQSRDGSTLCVVEEVKDIIAMERGGQYNGLYHVLQGAISPMDGIGPGDVRIKELLDRVKKGGVSEVILATDPNVEGEATANYVGKLLKPYGIKVTRIASGLPVGGDLEYADEITLARALEGRRDI